MRKKNTKITPTRRKRACVASNECQWDLYVICPMKDVNGQRIAGEFRQFAFTCKHLPQQPIFILEYRKCQWSVRQTILWKFAEHAHNKESLCVCATIYWNGNDWMAYGHHEIWHMQCKWCSVVLMVFLLLVKLPPFRTVCVDEWSNGFFSCTPCVIQKNAFETHCHLALHMCLNYGLFLLYILKTLELLQPAREHSSNESKSGWPDRLLTRYNVYINIGMGHI